MTHPDVVGVYDCNRGSGRKPKTFHNFHAPRLPHPEAPTSRKLDPTLSAGIFVLETSPNTLLDKRLTPDGLNLIQANQPAGWQTVFHFQIHLVPRWSGDGLTPPWTPSDASADRLGATLAPASIAIATIP